MQVYEITHSNKCKHMRKLILQMQTVEIPSPLISVYCEALLE